MKANCEAELYSRQKQGIYCSHLLMYSVEIV